MVMGAVASVKAINLKAWLGGTGTALGSVFLPSAFIPVLLLSTLGLILLDTATGILASRKQGIPIKSSKLNRMIEKVLGVGMLWLVLALVGNLLGVMLGSPTIGTFLISLGIGAVAVKESISNLENLLRAGIYITPAIKKKLTSWLGDLEASAETPASHQTE